jgi:hypothetical protein
MSRSRTISAGAPPADHGRTPESRRGAPFART